MLGHAWCQTCLEQGWEETRPPLPEVATSCALGSWLDLEVVPKSHLGPHHPATLGVLGTGTSIPASFRVPSQLSGAGAPGDGTRSKKGLPIVEVPPPLPGVTNFC